MDYFVETARTDGEVHSIIRRKYGDRARILSRKEIRVGGFLGMFRRPAVEITGYFSHATGAGSVASRGTAAEERRKILEQVGARVQQSESRAAGGPPGAAKGQATVPRNGSSAPDGGSFPPETPVSAGVREGRLRFSSVAGGKDSPGATLDEILAELRALKGGIGIGTGAEPEVLREVREILEYNDFSRAYSEELVERLRETCTLEELTDREGVMRLVSGWIAEGITTIPWEESSRRPRVFVLVGPTGVGKTTTIAKLAAMYGAVAEPRYDVRIITIDSYRIGALHQIEKYGEIMNIPVTAVENAEEMKKQLAICSEADFVFIDTIGKSPHDITRLAEVNDLVRAAGGEVHLAISATTKYSDIIDALRQFEPFDYRAVIVTKLDETGRVGGILSALHEKRKSMSFITDGQSVPQDIERARAEIFLRRLRDLPPPSSGGDEEKTLVGSRNEE